MQGIDTFVAGRLTQARAMCDGISKVALARMIDCSPATVTKWEQGTHSPQSEALTKLAMALKIPEHWFLRPLPIIQEPLFLNRSMKRATLTARGIATTTLKWAYEVRLTLQEWVAFPELDLIPALSRQESLCLTDGNIEELADEVRQSWNLGLGPINNLMAAVECAGINVIRAGLGYSEMDGTSAWIGGIPFIFVASDKANYFRSRFDLAHELAHLIMHRYATEQDYKDRYDEMERQAHYFASCLLIPNTAFVAEFRRPTMESLIALKRRWGLSIAAIIMKAAKLGLINDDQKVRFWKNYNYRKYRLSEPLDDLMVPEQPVTFQKAIKLLLLDGGFAKSNLIDKCALKSDLEKIANLPEGFLDDEFGQIVTMPQVTMTKAVTSALEPASSALNPDNIISINHFRSTN